VGGRVKVGSLGADRFTMAFSARSQRHAAVAAEGETVIVVYDYASGAKAPVTDELLAAIARVEGW
jgi:acyl-CoA thioesterase FadM